MSGSGTTIVDPADLMDTSARPPAASEAEFWTFLKNDFVHFQDLLLVFKAVFTQWHVHNRALDASGEAAFPVSQGEAVQSHLRHQVHHGGSQQPSHITQKKQLTQHIFKGLASAFLGLRWPLMQA